MPARSQAGKDIRTPWKMIPNGKWRTLGKVTHSLLEVLPATDVIGAKHYKTCAVVGSAGILLTQVENKRRVACADICVILLVDVIMTRLMVLRSMALNTTTKDYDNDDDDDDDEYIGDEDKDDDDDDDVFGDDAMMTISVMMP